MGGGLKSQQLPDGTFITTPIFVGPMPPKQFQDHEQSNSHVWNSLNQTPDCPSDLEWCCMERCECGAIRSRYKLKGDTHDR